jgi:hypothetical protein
MPQVLPHVDAHLRREQDRHRGADGGEEGDDRRESSAAPERYRITLRANSSATSRMMLRRSTRRIVCIAAFQANAPSGRPAGISRQPPDRTR